MMECSFEFCKIENHILLLSVW